LNNFSYFSSYDCW